MENKNDKKLSVSQAPFVGILILFVGFVLYGIFSFSTSLDNSMKASVLNVGESGTKKVATDNVKPYTGPVTSEAQNFDEIFVDVLTNHPNADAISYFKQMGYIGGYDDGTFKPDQLLNRAELLKILTNVLDVDFTGGVYENCFADVNSQWFATFVCYAKGKGWAGGYDDNTFRAVQTVTKAEALKIIMQALGVKIPTTVTEKPFKDVEIDKWYAPYARVAKDGNIARGNIFYQNLELNRASFVQMVYDVLAYTGKIVK